MNTSAPTEEMITAAMDTAVFEAARGASARQATRRALSAVLAIVVREYRTEPRPAWDREPPARDRCPYCMTSLE